MSSKIHTVMQYTEMNLGNGISNTSVTDCKWVHKSFGGVGTAFTPNDPLLRPSTHRSPSRSTLINWLSKMCRINGLTTPRLQSWSSSLRLGKPRQAPPVASSCGIATNVYPGRFSGLCFISLIRADSAKLLWGSALTANYRNLPCLLIENNGLKWASAAGGDCTDLYTFHLNMCKTVECTHAYLFRKKNDTVERTFYIRAFGRCFIRECIQDLRVFSSWRSNPCTIILIIKKI